jgi:AraC family transcriptional regulator
MDNSVVGQFVSAPGASGLRWNSRSCAGCAGLTAIYMERIAESTEEHYDNTAITVLIPGDQGAFNASYRTEDGRCCRTYVRAPELSVIPPGQSHALAVARPSDMIIISMDCKFFGETARIAIASETTDVEATEVVGRFAAADPFLRELGNTLFSEFRLNGTPGAAYLECLAGVVAIHLAANYCSGQVLPLYSGLSTHRLKTVQAFIKDHLSEAIRVEQLAAIVDMSPFHFARMFKKATGKAPHAYVNAQRIEHAKELLRDSDLPLVDVAATVGFQTQAHFTGVFQKHVSLTPRSFRLKFRASAPLRGPARKNDPRHGRNPTSSARFGKKLPDVAANIFP